MGLGPEPLVPRILCVGLGKACELLCQPDALVRREMTAELRDYFFKTISNHGLGYYLKWTRIGRKT